MSNKQKQMDEMIALAESDEPLAIFDLKDSNVDALLRAPGTINEGFIDVELELRQQILEIENQTLGEHTAPGINEKKQVLIDMLKEIKDETLIYLPVSMETVKAKRIRLSVEDCEAHPLNMRRVKDHNRHTLASRIASFKRIGQQKPALVTIKNGRVLIVDGIGRWKAWSLIQKESDADESLKGNQFIVDVCDISDADAFELSKTYNESKEMSEYSLAKMYHEMLNMGSYRSLSVLCKSEGIDYEVCKKRMSLASINEKYIDIFLSTTDIPLTYYRTVREFESLASESIDGERVLSDKLKEYRDKVFQYLDENFNEPPYPIHKKQGRNTMLIDIKKSLIRAINSKSDFYSKSFIGDSFEASIKKTQDGGYTIRVKKHPLGIEEKLELFMISEFGAKQL